MIKQPRDVRRLAMQAMYQMDVTQLTDLKQLEQLLNDDFDDVKVRQHAIELAKLAWEVHAQADAKIAAIAPKWPTHRQPPVDRAILRLAYYEMISQRTPIKVAINEAIELAKKFGSKESGPFVNGVLDKLAKTLNTPETPPPVSPDTPDASEAPEAPKTLETSNIPEAPKTPDTPDTPAPVLPDIPTSCSAEESSAASIPNPQKAN